MNKNVWQLVLRLNKSKKSIPGSFQSFVLCTSLIRVCAFVFSISLLTDAKISRSVWGHLEWIGAGSYLIISQSPANQELPKHLFWVSALHCQSAVSYSKMSWALLIYWWLRCAGFWGLRGRTMCRLDTRVSFSHRSDPRLDKGRKGGEAAWPQVRYSPRCWRCGGRSWTPARPVTAAVRKLGEDKPSSLKALPPWFASPSKVPLPKAFQNTATNWGLSVQTACGEHFSFKPQQRVTKKMIDREVSSVEQLCSSTVDFSSVISVREKGQRRKFWEF